MKGKKLFEWEKHEIERLEAFVKTHSDTNQIKRILVVGSYVQEGAIIRENSDIDIIIETTDVNWLPVKTRKLYKTTGKHAWLETPTGKVKVSIMYRLPSTYIYKNRGYHLSYYDLSQKKLYKGKDDKIYQNWKKKWKKL